ncbi:MULTISPECIES: hypothetical protein [Archaeoglobus]|nr:MULTISPECIES: hypothetical protein [Archaeoglobus]
MAVRKDYIEVREELFDWGLLDKISFEDFLEKLAKHYSPEPVREMEE